MKHDTGEGKLSSYYNTIKIIGKADQSYILAFTFRTQHH